MVAGGGGLLEFSKFAEFFMGVRGGSILTWLSQHFAAGDIDIYPITQENSKENFFPILNKGVCPPPPLPHTHMQVPG